MITFKFILGWFILTILFVFPYRVSGQISKTLSYNKTGIERNIFKKGGNAYESVMFKQSYPSHDVGKPDLPVFYYQFYITKGQVATDIKFKSIKQDDIQLTSDLTPVQHPVITSFSGSDTLFDVPDTKVYNTDSFYPDKQANILSTDFIDGNLQIVTVEVYPMQYQPKQKKLRLSSDVEISLVTSSNPDSKSTLVVPKFHDTESLVLLKSLVQNPGDVPSVDEPVEQTASNLKSATITSWTIPFYEYVIITSRALKPAFSEFLTWKKRKGYNAGIVCIDEIMNDPAATGDIISNLNDSAGKIRQYLRAGFTNTNPKTKWALLGGDYSVVPIRYGCGAENTWDLDGMINEEKVPTDLYFSEMTGNWNFDGDIYTGENNAVDGSGDRTTSNIDIYVGRLLCTSETDVKNWTQKLLKYEQNPGNGNYSYLTKSLFTEADGIGFTNPMFLPSIFTTRDTIKESPSDYANWPTYPKGADVISLLNSGYGLYSNFNHGSPCSFATATYGVNGWENHDAHIPYRYQVTTSDNYLDDVNITPENGNGFDNLTNTNNPFPIYSISCTNIPFDDYDTYSGSRNLGESFTCMRLTGGPAYLGNTREGSNAQEYFFRDFLTQIQLTNHIGMAEATSKIGKGMYYKDVLSHNIIGCPEMPMWTVTPSLFNGSATESGTSLAVNTGGVVADRICVMSALNDGYFQVKPNVSSFTFTDIPQPYYVTITKANYIPSRNLLTNVYIENKPNINSVAILNCQTITAGNDVIPNNGVAGDVVIQGGADITFNTSGDILLSNGFEVTYGAIFNANAGPGYGSESNVGSVLTIIVIPTLDVTTLGSFLTCSSATSGGYITSDGGATITERGICWSTSANPTITDSKTTSGTGSGSFTATLSPLLIGTTYHVRSYATNSAGTGYGAEITYTPGITLPTLATTTSASSITSNSASSGGYVTSDGCGTVTTRGICWATTPNPTTANSTVACGTGTGTYIGNLTGLLPGTTYYVCSYATNSAGTGYGGQISFTTLAIPTLTSTSAVTGVTCTSATSGGYVSSDGGSAISARGVCYATIPNPTIANSKTTDGGTTGSWTSGTMTLVPGTMYYVKSYATNSIGTGYGPQVNYTQSIAVPALATTTAASSITINSAISGGNVTSDGCGTVTTRGICWATTPNPTTSNSIFANGSGTGTYTGNLTGLASGTTYYVRSYAINSAGTGYGGQISFTTSAIVIPTLAATTAVTGVTCTTATSGGNVTADGGGTISARGVCYGITSNPTTANSITSDGGTTGSWTSGTMILVPGTMYYVRSYATNQSGTGYGTQVTYTKSITVPTLATTTTANSITSNSATSGGNVTSDGCGTVTARGICWATTQNPTTSNSIYANGSGTGTYTGNLTGLSPYTTYYVRSYAINSAGTAYGAQISFTTLGITANITSSLVSSGATYYVVQWMVTLSSPAAGSITIPCITTNATNTGNTTVNVSFSQGQQNSGANTIMYTRPTGTNFTAYCTFGTMPTGYIAGSTANYVILKQ